MMIAGQWLVTFRVWYSTRARNSPSGVVLSVLLLIEGTIPLPGLSLCWLGWALLVILRARPSESKLIEGRGCLRGGLRGFLLGRCGILVLRDALDFDTMRKYGGVNVGCRVSAVALGMTEA